MPLRIAAAAARRQPLPDMLVQTMRQVKETLGPGPVDLACLFFSVHYEDEGETLIEALCDQLQPRSVIGCSTEGVIGPEHEYENEPALVVWAARFPAGTRVHDLVIDANRMAAAQEASDWRSLFPDLSPEDQPSFLLLADPFSTPIHSLLTAINQSFPDASVHGGMVSGAEAPGQASLISDQGVQREGLVGVALTGPLRVASLVSQGCRPIGKPWVITKSDRNIMYQIGGQKPLEVLMQTFEESPPDIQRMMQQGILLGRVIKEEQERFGRGDFLIRNLVDKDDQSGALAVNDLLRPGITIQFHVRDAATAHEDLENLAQKQQAEPPRGALLFSCNGRGLRLFERKDHDIGVLKQCWGDAPIAGMFCAGELGPIGGKNFIHGFTASVACFHEADGGESMV